MREQLYRQRKNRLIAGVFAGLADKFGLELSLIRLLYIAFSVISIIPGVILYLLLAISLPEKEGMDPYIHGSRPRHLKKAEKIK